MPRFSAGILFNNPDADGIELHHEKLAQDGVDGILKDICGISSDETDLIASIKEKILELGTGPRGTGLSAKTIKFYPQIDNNHHVIQTAITSSA